jgi:hypothetical protein
MNHHLSMAVVERWPLMHLGLLLVPSLAWSKQTAANSASTLNLTY